MQSYSEFCDGCCLIDSMIHFVYAKMNKRLDDKTLLNTLLSIYLNRKELKIGDDAYVNDSNLLVNFIAKTVGEHGWHELRRSKDFTENVDLAVIKFKYGSKTHFCLGSIKDGNVIIKFDGYGQSTCRLKGKVVDYRTYGN